MSYGDYRLVIPKPETMGRPEWEAYIDRKEEMEAWIQEQRWDHWGVLRGGTEGFWFNVEENYTAVKKHFGIE